VLGGTRGGNAQHKTRRCIVRASNGRGPRAMPDGRWRWMLLLLLLLLTVAMMDGSCQDAGCRPARTLRERESASERCSYTHGRVSLADGRDPDDPGGPHRHRDGRTCFHPGHRVHGAAGRAGESPPGTTASLPRAGRYLHMDGSIRLRCICAAGRRSGRRSAVQRDPPNTSVRAANGRRARAAIGASRCFAG